MNREVFERRMFRIFARELRRIEEPKPFTTYADFPIYKETSMFRVFLLRIALLQLIRTVLRQISPIKTSHNVPPQIRTEQGRD